MSTSEANQGQQERLPLDRSRIICPLTFKVTGGKAAVNYDIQESTLDTAQGKIPGWRSSPHDRGHTDAFLAGLEELKEQGKVPKDWKAYYFSQEQGEQARLRYQELVLSGKVKAHKRSWGPTGEQGTKDKSRFHKLVDEAFIMAFNKKYENVDGVRSDWEYPVTFDQLESTYKELYGVKETTTASGGKEKVSKSEPAEMPASAEDALDMDEITGEEDALQEMEGPSEDELREEETREAVAASTTMEQPVADLSELRPEDIDIEEIEPIGEVEVEESMDAGEGTVETIHIVHPIGSEQSVGSDSIFWKAADGTNCTAYLVWIPGLEREMWLEEGDWEIDGHQVNVKVEKKPGTN